MKKTGFLLLALCFLLACSERKGPDVSNIPVKIELVRFEKDFFALDTTQLVASVNSLARKHPEFFQDFIVNILGLPPEPDPDGRFFEAIKLFLHDYKPVYDSAAPLFNNMDKPVAELTQALKYVKYYFPKYAAPTRLITYIGPMDAYYEATLGGYSDVMTMAGMATGLQLHMGSGFSMYNSEMGLALYPAYISRRFAPNTIVVNTVKNVVDDLYRDKSAGLPLVEQMIEKGKRLYLLDQFLPETADTLKIGYTAKQLKGCEDNEGKIWNFFVMNNLLLNSDPAIVKSYLNDGPKTQELGDGSPGFIGLFCGRQIVRAFMEKNTKLTLQQLLDTPARKIYEDSKYRPK